MGLLHYKYRFQGMHRREGTITKKNPKKRPLKETLRGGH